MSTLKSFQASWLDRIEEELDTLLPSESTPPSTLHQAMRYAVLGGGKRLRPLLGLAAAESCGGPTKQALKPALATEILHAYTLVHDDLPCMDDDALRRGKPSTHVAFGEAIALLAGDSLLTMAFEWTAECLAPEPYPATQFTLELARYAGSQGVIGGQVVDLESEGQTPDLERLQYIHKHKTADLMTAALRMGGIAAGASPAQLKGLTTFGNYLGMAFQIADDILDETQSSETLGKPAGSDLEKGKCTYPALLGLEGSKKAAADALQQAKKALEGVVQDPALLNELADTLVNRSY